MGSAELLHSEVDNKDQHRVDRRVEVYSDNHWLQPVECHLVHRFQVEASDRELPDSVQHLTNHLRRVKVDLRVLAPLKTRIRTNKHLVAGKIKSDLEVDWVVAKLSDQLNNQYSRIPASVQRCPKEDRTHIDKNTKKDSQVGLDRELANKVSNNNSNRNNHSKTTLHRGTNIVSLLSSRVHTK